MLLIPKTHADSTQSFGTTTAASSTPQPQLQIAQVGEQLETNYIVHEIPGPSGVQPDKCHLINQTQRKLMQSAMYY